MMTRLANLLRELPASLAALVVATIAEIGFHTTTLPRLAEVLRTPLATDPTPATEVSRTDLPSWARRRVRATRRVLRHWPFGDTCLRQALISGYLLHRLGPSLHLGVARIDGEIRAHAWVVVEGGILDPRVAATSYQTLRQPGENPTR